MERRSRALTLGLGRSPVPIPRGRRPAAHTKISAPGGGSGRRRRLVAACAFAVIGTTVLSFSAPARAITYGTADAVHTFAGAWVTMRSDGIVVGCSGALVAPRVFLTAGHCAGFFMTGGGGLSLSGQPIPLSAMFVTLAIDRRDQSAWRPVAAYAADPLFAGIGPGNGNGPHFDDSHDLAIVILANPVTDVSPGNLVPEAGYLDALAARGGLVPLQTTFQVVGSGQDQTFTRTFTREVAAEAFLALEPAWLVDSMNPALGYGGSCIGDSGGPVLFASGTAEYIVAIVSAGDAHCRAMDKDYRVDTSASLAFINGEIAANP